MKHFLKIKESHWLPGSTTKMIYEAENGIKFIGSPIHIEVGKTLVVELSEEPMKDGYYETIQIIGQI